MYHAAFAEATMKNPRLLVVGYSFGDLHFNRFIDRLRRLHGSAMRVVVIDYVPPRMRHDSWAPEADIRDWPGLEMFKMLARISKQPRVLSGKYQNPWMSTDGQVRVYLEGFRQAVEAHGDEIIAFLNS
jgi:hypothetical protein